MLEQKIRAADARPTESEICAMARQAYDELLSRFCEQQRCSPQLSDTHSVANRAFADYYQRCIEHGGDAPFTDAEREVLARKWGLKRVQELEQVIALAEQGHVFIKPRFVDARLREMGFAPHDGIRRQVTVAMYEPYRDACWDADLIMRGLPAQSRFAADEAASSAHSARPSHHPMQAEAVAEPAASPPDTSPDLYEISIRAAAAKQGDDAWTAKTARQRMSLGRLFTLLMGEIPVSSITQGDLATFMRKRRLINQKLSPLCEKEAQKILALVAKNEAIDGRIEGAPSAATINRDVTGLSALLDWADGQGYAMNDFKTDKLRVRQNGRSRRARDERPATSEKDMRKVFALPTFTGSQPHGGGKGQGTLNRRFKPGKVIIHDFFYWVPLLVYYLGCRREEICKLCTCDFVLDAPVPFVRIRKSHNGDIKTAASARSLPLHPELIRLGLIDYVREIETRRYKALFPELRPTNNVESFGDQFYDLAWVHIRKRGELSEDAEIHGVRHSFGASLKRGRVTKEERADLLGHVGESETDERYSEATRLQFMLENMRHLPNLTSHLQPAAIEVPVYRGQVPKLTCEPLVDDWRSEGGGLA